MVDISNYNAVLKELKAERQELLKRLEGLENAIFFVEKNKDKFSVASKSSQSPKEESAQAFKGNEFETTSVADATVMCLKKFGKPLSTTELLDALFEGGIKSRAQNKRNSIRNSITFSTANGIRYKKNSDGYWELIPEKPYLQNKNPQP